MYLEQSSLFIPYYYWVLPIGISVVLYKLLDGYLKSLYKNVVSVFAQDIMLRGALTVFLLLKWFNFIDFDTFVAAHSLIYIVPPLILIFYLWYLGELNLSVSSIKISKRFRRILIQFTSFSYMNTLGQVLVNSLDIIMIAQFIGLEATGVYAIVVFMASALDVPYRSIIRVSSPLIAEYWRHRQLEKIKELYVKVSGVSLFIGLTLFLVIWLNIDLIFSFFKPEFKEGVWVFFFLMIGRLIDMFSGLNGSIFVTSKKYKYEVVFTVFLIIAVFSLNLLFIPWWGIAGAAISTAVSMIFYNIGRLVFVWKIYKIHPFKARHFIIIGLAILTFFVGTLVGNLIAHPWIQFAAEIGVGTVLFILPVFLFKLEPEIINYTNKGLDFVKIKVGRKTN
jgi:O-antigen/teichoic acid export membrane protein